MSADALHNLNDEPPTPPDSDQPLPASTLGIADHATERPLRAWTYAALVRALKTAAQAAIGVLGTGAVGLLQVDWANTLSVAAMGAILSLLTSIAGIPEADSGASLANIMHDEN